MIRKIRNTKGLIPIIICVLCIANLALGFELIKKITKTERLGINREVNVGQEETVSTFSNSKNNADNKSIENKNLKKETKQETKLNSNKKSNDKLSNILMRLLIDSNAYMNVAFEENYKKDRKIETISTTDYVISKVSRFFEPKKYLKSQLPAILNLVDDERKIQTVDKNIKNEKYEDIVFVEDFAESTEGVEITSTEDNNSGQKPNSIKINDADPYILIYHTHGTESFLPATEGNFHSTRREYNILTIGEIVGTVLKEKGHKLKHIDMYHDTPSFNKSYVRSLETVKDELNKNKNLKVLLDIHRDGVDEKNVQYAAKIKERSKIKVNGKDVATFSLVVGPQNPNKDKLLEFARYIKEVANQMYPGICRGVTVKSYGKFNQYVSDYSALIEVGSNLNTIEEAKESGKLLGEILNKVITDIKQE
ncbi:stage II sporulation P [Gottschalkia purinilytica]|uniref:Stage II sporulation P n=1 Tax=Gottschalkia purinilytica TaxID=1503 RepID=A0A0L0WD50_GOTPU|nr:stage II sporulation protein P [Gottschalkia purinilytica]KNF09366.1 stage II sporulation P [Gottschalkia purinilytica]